MRSELMSRRIDEGQKNVVQREVLHMQAMIVVLGGGGIAVAVVPGIRFLQYGFISKFCTHKSHRSYAAIGSCKTSDPLKGGYAIR